MTLFNWSAAIQHCQQSGSAYVIATIINTQGSTPRDGGSKMVIAADATYDTIGGGQLEFLLVQQARELLAQNKNCQVLKAIPLAAEAAQCCGGSSWRSIRRRLRCRFCKPCMACRSARRIWG